MAESALLPRDEHVVAPDEEAQQGDRHRRESDGAVAEDPLPAERADQLGDDPEAGQDHDVDGGVAVEPEEVLEEDRVAAEGRVEDADLEHALEEEEQHRDPDHGRGQDLHDAGGVEAPDEEGQPVPRHPRRPHLVDGDDEVDAGEDRREARDKDRHRHEEHGPARVVRGVRGVERPARIDLPVEQRPHDEDAPQEEDVVRGEVEAGEGDVLRADVEPARRSCPARPAPTGRGRGRPSGCRAS